MVRLAALPVLVLVAVLVAWKLGYFELDRRRQLFETVQRLRVVPWIGTLYVLAYAVAVMVGLPAAIATIVGGAIFGMWFGALNAWLGALVGTALAHWLAHSVARKPLRRLFGEHRLLRELKDHDDVLALFRLRVIPVGTLGVLPYVAGIAGVSLQRLLVASALGLLPSAVAYAYVGRELLRGMVSPSDASRRALLIAGAVTVVMLLLSVVPRVVQKLRK
jgi:uncharacterized membrane protein YdjX (TVP38/TMEM64 family)